MKDCFSRWRGLLPILVAWVATMIAAPARAADNICTFGGSLFTTPVDFGKIVNVPAVINMARDSSRGAGSTIGPVTTRSVTINCGKITTGSASDTGGYRIRMRVLTPLAKTSSNDIAFAPGIGLRITNKSPGDISNAIVAGGEISWRPDIVRNGSTSSVTDTVEFRLVTAVPAAPAAGTYTSPAGTFVIYADTNSIGNSAPFVTSADSPQATSSTATVAVPTCSSSDVQVQLPPVRASDLSAPGTVAGTTPFAITLNCPQGYTSLPIRLYMTLTDTDAPVTMPLSNTLSLSPVSTAQGVRVQINRSDLTKSVVSYGIDSAIPGNPGQFNTDAVLPPNAAGTVTIPFTAAYISTGVVTGGIVKAVATYTLSYQ